MQERYEGDTKQAMGLVAEKQARREKTRDECGIEERLERLRAVEQQRNAFANDLLMNVRERVEKLEQHSHGQHGEVTVPLRYHGHSGGMVAGRSYDPLA